jgi:2'-5' RNA ligase
MRHRIFIAINLPEKIKNKLVEYQLKWFALPCRWTKKENLHITLEFLGYLTDEELIEICQKTKEVITKKKTFSVKLNKICYGPINKKLTKRMVWVMGERIEEGDEAKASSSRFVSLRSTRVFNFVPHITLGRIKTWQFKQIEPEERPEINEGINLNFKVKSIEIMESKLKRNDPEYIILESILFKT